MGPSAVTGKARLVTTTAVLPPTVGTALSRLSRVAGFHGRKPSQEWNGLR